jgi:hypothetical protein
MAMRAVWVVNLRTSTTGELMPVSYTIDQNQRLVVSCLSGAVTETEVHEHNRSLRADRDFNPSYRQLVDCTGVTEILLGVATINVVSQHQFFAPGTRRAFIATSDVAFGLARMFALRAECSGQTIEVFRERLVAEEWLGI